MIVDNSKFEISEEMNGKGRPFKSRFIEAGLVNYEPDGLGQVLIKKETIDKFANTMVGCPVVIEHQEVNDKNLKQVRVGSITDVWFNPDDAWFWCSGIIDDKEAMSLINNGASVSCTYKITESDKTGGVYHDNLFDKEVLDGEFLYLAIVQNPRYEDARIVLNSSSRKTMFNLFRKKGELNMVDNAKLDKNAKKDKLLRMLNTAIKGQGEIDGMSEEEYYKKFNEILDELSYDKDEVDNKSQESEEEVDNACAKNEAEETKAEDKSEKESKEEKEDKKDSEEKADNTSSFEAIDNASKSTGALAPGYMSRAERIALGKKLF